MDTFSTRDEAVAKIVETIEASGVVEDARAEYDVDAIADVVLGDYDQGYAQQVDEAEFWTVVAAHER